MLFRSAELRDAPWALDQEPQTVVLADQELDRALLRGRTGHAVASLPHLEPQARDLVTCLVELAAQSLDIVGSVSGSGHGGAPSGRGTGAAVRPRITLPAGFRPLAVRSCRRRILRA